LSKEVLQSTLS